MHSRYGTVLMMAALFTVLITSCSRRDIENNNNTAITDTENDTIMNVVGPNGGTITTPSGKASLYIPAGALSSNITVTITQSAIGDAPGGLVGGYQFSPDGASFSLPITLKLKYEPSVIPDGISTADVKLAYESGGKWVIISNSSVDQANNLVSGQITHFSTYAVTPPVPPTYNSYVGNFNFVDIISNGSTDYFSNSYHFVDSVNTGMKWQCVEFVNRYYLQVYHLDIRRAGDDAKVYYQKAGERGLSAYPNGGSVPPQIGDIIVSEGDGTPTNHGHVAIISKVTNTMIYVAQQNWFENEGDKSAPLARSGNAIGPFGGSKSYKIKGWLRTPSSTYTISGTVTSGTSGLAGVAINLYGSYAASVITDANGNYNFAGLSTGNYTITPALTGYTFLPVSKTVTVNNADISGQDFSGTATTSPPVSNTYSIFGQIALNNVGLSGVTVTLTGYGPPTTSTDGQGNYSFSEIANGTYTITPSKTGYSFSPASLSATIYGANVTGKNFIASDTTAPSLPTGFNAVTVSSSQINLYWSASTDNVGVAGYYIYRNGIYLKAVSGTSTSDDNLTSSTQYCYKISAYDAAGNESGQSGQSCTTTSDIIDSQAPSVPSNLSATSAGTNQINLSWTASTDNIGVAGYKLYRYGAYLKQITGTSTNDSGLSANTQYCYTVSAYDTANNESGQSSQACATTNAIPETCNGIDDDGNGIIDDAACWTAIYRFKSSNDARCWGTNDFTPPSTCAGYTKEIEAFIIPKYNIPNTFPLAQCSKSTDHILVNKWSQDYTTLTDSNHNYVCTDLGFAWYPGQSITGLHYLTANRNMCRVWRFSYTVSGGSGAHLFTRGADNVTGMVCESSDVFEIITSDPCTTPIGQTCQ